MTLTKTERRKLAKAARELAADCEAGKVSSFGAREAFDWDGTPICALGHVYHRAFGSDAAAMYAKEAATRAEGNVIWRNDMVRSSERPNAVVEPLRAYADELESAP